MTESTTMGGGTPQGPQVGQQEGRREGSLGAPTRHPLGWDQPGFYDEEALLKEMERRGLSTGLATMCIGGGQAGTMILERT